MDTPAISIRSNSCKCFSKCNAAIFLKFNEHKVLMDQLLILQNRENCIEIFKFYSFKHSIIFLFAYSKFNIILDSELTFQSFLLTIHRKKFAKQLAYFVNILTTFPSQIHSDFVIFQFDTNQPFQLSVFILLYSLSYELV